MTLVRLLLLCVLSALMWQASAVDLNQAGLAELRQIKGIGPKTAERIIEERTRAGPFDSLQDLSDRVKGIGPKRLATLEDRGLKIGSAPSPKSVAPTLVPMPASTSAQATKGKN